MNLSPLDKEMLAKMGIAPNAMPIRPAFDLGIHIPSKRPPGSKGDKSGRG